MLATSSSTRTPGRSSNAGGRCMISSFRSPSSATRPCSLSARCGGSLRFSTRAPFLLIEHVHVLCVLRLLQVPQLLKEGVPAHATTRGCMPLTPCTENKKVGPRFMVRGECGGLPDRLPCPCHGSPSAGRGGGSLSDIKASILGSWRRQRKARHSPTGT